MRRTLIALAGVVPAILVIFLVGRQPEMDSARALQCGLAAAILALLAFVLRGWLRNTLVILCSLVFGVTVLESLALAMRPAPTGIIENVGGLNGLRPLVGWGPPKPGVYHSNKIEPGGHVVYDMTATIDDNLNRKTVSAEGPRPIVFFGDSWIFGAGLNDEATIPQAFADVTGRQIPVLNLGYTGWSPATNLIALQKGLYKSLIQQPRHFVLFAAMFHVERTACRGAYRFRGAPYFVASGETVRYLYPCYDIGSRLRRLFVNFARTFTLYDRIAPYFDEPSARDVETFIKIVEAFVAQAKQDYGVQTTVLVSDKGDGYIRQAGYTPAQIVERWRKAGIDVLLDTLPKIANEDLYWIPGDLHPSALANEARAKAIKAHLEKVDPDALKVAADQSR